MAESVRFQHYEVLRRDDGGLWELGRGAMGITYKAYDTNLRCDAALKVINATYLGDEMARQRFLREARAAAAIRHRNVAAVYHLGMDEDAIFYAMEFVAGETVEDFMRREGAVPTPMALDIVMQVARALGAAEKQGLVHRDIKPSNLMLMRQAGEDLLVKVIDFGLAKGADQATGFEAATITVGGFLGTPHFASPEQLEEGELDVRSDIYSLGVTLYYMLAGKAPFSGSVAQVMSQHLHREPPLEAFATQPEAVVMLLERMLAKDPAGRPQTAADLRGEVTACLEASGGEASIPMEGTSTGSVAAQEFETAVMDGVEVESPMEPEPGVVLAGRFELLDEYSPGEFGQTFRAKNLETGELVAVLILEPKLLPTSQAYTRLEDEISALQRVRHPSIVRVDSLEHAQPINFLTREWVEGPTLLDALRVRGSLSAGEAMLVLTSLAGGLEELSGAGLPCPVLAADWITLVPGEAEPGQPKFNAISLTGVVPVDANATRVDLSGGAGPDSGAFSGNSGAEFAFALARIAYEVFGGTRLGAGLRTFVPIGTLSEDANRVMRQAFDPKKGYRSPSAFVAELGDAVDDACGVVSAPAASDVAVPPPKPETPPISRVELSRAPRRKIRGVPVVAGFVGLLVAVGGFLFLNRSPDESRGAAAPTPVPSPTMAPELVRDSVAASPTAAPAPSEAMSPSEAVALAEALADSDPDRYFKYATLAAEAGSPEGTRLVAKAFEEGIGVEADPALAFENFRKAGELGEQRSLYATGLCYLQGSGVQTDVGMAIHYLDRASEMGYVYAQTRLGDIYRLGIGIEQPNRVEAFRLLNAASDQGFPDAQALLGQMYIDGEIVDGRPVAGEPQRNQAGRSAGLALLREAMAEGSGLAKQFYEQAGGDPVEE